MNFGQRLKETRLQFGLTQREFASRLGIDHSHLSRLERGQSQASRALVERMIETLGLDEEWQEDDWRVAAGYAPKQWKEE